MAQFVEILIIVSLVFSVFLWRDNSAHALNRRLSKQGIGVISPVGQQIVGLDPLDQATCLRAIRAGAFCNKDSDRQTKRIHGQVYLGVEPPFVRLMA